METDNLARVRSSLAALDARNEAAFLSGLAENVVVDDLLEARPREGKAGAKAWFASWTSAVPDGRSEIVTALPVNDSVLVEAVVRGTLTGRWGPVSAAVKPFTVHRAAIVRVRAGAIDRITLFTNGKELAQAVGQWPPPAAR
jgi:ketosteroid isomerase-like protein